MFRTEYTSQRDLTSGFRQTLAGKQNKILHAAYESDPVLDFARSVATGLSDEPRSLECRFLYDARGSELYERITQQPEYYPARTEVSILAGCARQIRELTGRATLLELGSGSSVKTDTLFDAYLERDARLTYVPVDVSASALYAAGQAIGEKRPGVQFIGVNGTYEDAFCLMKEASPTMGVFFGGSIGNLTEEEADVFWGRVSDSLAAGDHFLVGVDLHKNTETLEKAYNDAAGVTEAFTRNLFVRMNRELDAGIDVSAVEHVANYNVERQRIEIYARFREPQQIRVAPLDRVFDIEAGERILTEISRKFRLEQLLPHLESFGLTRRELFTDPQDQFALVLLVQNGRNDRSTS